MNLSTTCRKLLYWLTWGLLIIIGLAAAVALWQWYDDGGGFEAVYVAIGVLLAGLWAANRFLARQQTEAQTNQLTYQSLPPDPQSLAEWRQKINASFTLEELRILVFELGITYDNLAGNTLDGKIVSLLEYAQHHNQLPPLHAKLKQLRPHVIWPNPGQQSLAHDDRNRANFLNLVQSSWIGGFLHQSLHREVLKLTLSYQPDAVPQRAWGMVLQQTGRSDQTVPPEQSVREIFERHGRSLLLLGDPGSGKTITMLQLAEELVKLAQDDPAQPTPVVLNLSSWAQGKPPLVEWLVEEIFVQYGVARELGRRWIAQNRLLYLLDGLDEVATAARDDCITAINEFKAVYPAEMLVCSRIKDYEALRNRLHLGAAVRIQPLTDAQVDDFLRQPGLEMHAVRAMLKSDPTLRELTQSPLLLNVMALAYQGKSMADLKALTTVEARRRHLFDAYVDTMFQRRPLSVDCLYNETNARHWLTWLAGSMNNHEQSVFFIERLQPTWLVTEKQHRLYGLIVGLAFGLIFGLISGLIFGLSVGRYAVPLMITRSVVIDLSGGLIFRVGVGLSVGMIVGVSVWLITGLSENERLIELVEELTGQIPSWRNLFQEVMVGLILGLSAWLMFVPIVGLIYGLSIRLIYGLLTHWSFWLSVALRAGVSVGLIIGLIVVMDKFLDAFFIIQESRVRLEPNQGICSSRKNMWQMSRLKLLIYGIVALGLFLFINWLNGKVNLVGYEYILATAPVIVVSSGLFFGFWTYGGKTIIRHYTLRWLLAWQNMLPFPFQDKELVAFFDAMVERILLRRAGGGYLFVHRALLEHFAAQSPYFAREQGEQ